MSKRRSAQEATPPAGEEWSSSNKLLTGFKGCVVHEQKEVSKVVGCEQGGSAKALSLTVEQGLTRVFVESEVDNVEILGMSKQAIAQNSTSCRGGVRPVQEAPSSADGLPTGELLRHVQQMGGTDFRIHVWVRLIDPAKKCHLQQGEVDGPPQEAASLAGASTEQLLQQRRSLHGFKLYRVLHRTSCSCATPTMRQGALHGDKLEHVCFMKQGALHGDKL
eukprot:1160472-Pelagomonas_calceolata.AAC.2